MTYNDCLTTLYSYRLYPLPKSVPHILTFIRSERLLWNVKTAIPFAGVVTGFCDRHPFLYDEWRANHKDLLHQAISISKSKAKYEALWAEYLLMRWFVLGTDKAAWELLCLAHYGIDEGQRMAAQTVISKITRLIDHAPHTNTQGVLVGKVEFEDMRLQMLRLANEFRRFPVQVRRQLFELLPWGPESVQAQLMESTGLPLVGSQPILPSSLIQ